MAMAVPKQQNMSRKKLELNIICDLIIFVVKKIPFNMVFGFLAFDHRVINISFELHS